MQFRLQLHDFWAKKSRIYKRFIVPFLPPSLEALKKETISLGQIILPIGIKGQSVAIEKLNVLRGSRIPAAIGPHRLA